MKRINLSVLVLVVLVLAGVVAAIAQTPPATTPGAGTTGTSATGISATGTVVSVNGDMVTLRTATGEETYRLSTSASRDYLTPGSRVTLWYQTSTSAGERPMVTRVTQETGTTGSAPTTPTTPRTGTTTDQPQTGTPSGTTTGQDMPRDTYDTSASPSRTTGVSGEELPATASPLPILGLVGLLAMTGGAILRMRRGAGR